jgi:alginate O-acetyltransferase complex protein AlgI
MSFTSPDLYLWLTPAVIVFHRLPARFRAPYLLALSYGVYWLLSPMWLALLVATTLAAHAIGRRIARAESPRRNGWWTALGVTSLCAVLLLFKLQDPLARLGTLPPPWRDLVLPVGVSFYFLRLVGYLLDTHWDATAHEPSLVRFALWTAFFPEIVNGPIQRPREFLPQLDAAPFRQGDFEMVERGCGLILWGLFQKLVIADRLAAFVAAVDAAPESYGRATLVLASYACVLEIYADFAGFTHVVIGMGRLFGIEGPPNFDAPFAATSIQAFWRRWHMSLTRWLGDYVYTPLRLGPLRRGGQLGIAVALMTTMLLIGLWHRLSTGYLAFGLLHGVFMVGSVMTAGARDRWLAGAGRLAWLRRVWGVALTFNLVAFAQIFARASTLRRAWQMLSLFARNPTPTTRMGIEEWAPLVACAVAAFLIGVGLVDAVAARRRIHVPRWLQYSLALLALVLLAGDDNRPFFYVDF